MGFSGSVPGVLQRDQTNTLALYLAKSSVEFVKSLYFSVKEYLRKLVGRFESSNIRAFPAMCATLDTRLNAAVRPPAMYSPAPEYAIVCAGLFGSFQ